jgi:hypothetical protein
MDKLSNEQKNFVDSEISLLQYHQKHMSERRSLGFQAFLALIGLYIVAIKGVTDAHDFINKSFSPTAVRLSVSVGCLFLFFIYKKFMDDIERASIIDRQRYHYFAADLFHILQGKARPTFAEETPEETKKISWARKWTVRAALIVMLSCVLFIFLSQ